MRTPKRMLRAGVLFFVVCGSLLAQVKTSVLLNRDILVIRTDGLSFLGSGINEDDAKTLAINDAKRNALEQAGTYLESHATVLNNRLEKDEIITFSGGLLKIEVLKEERKLVNSMFAFQVAVEATIDTRLLDQRIAEIRKDSGLREQLEAERDRNKKLQDQIAQLQASGDSASRQDVKNVINELSASDWAVKAYYSKDLSQQIDYYTKAIELDPRYIVAYNNRGYANNALGRYEAAIRDYGSAVALDPQNSDFYAGLGYAHYNLGNFTTAIQDYNTALGLKPQNADFYVGRGNAIYGLGDFPASIQDYSAAIQANPQHVVAYVCRGNAYHSLNNYQAAIQDYNSAVILDPNYPDAYYNRGNSIQALGDFPAAFRDYNTAIALNPRHGLAYVARGNAYFGAGDFMNALRDYDSSIMINPQYPIAYINRGNAHGRLGNNQAAADDYNRYLQINGNRNGDAETVRQWIRNLGYTPMH
jgi:tetratricopeptide (TPR) repeat protein